MQAGIAGACSELLWRDGWGVGKRENITMVHCSARFGIASRLLIFFLITFSAVAFVRAGTVRFAVIGDFGVDDGNESAVANLVKNRFQPDFILTLGDNNYGTGADYDRVIGKFYAAYVGNYSGAYGTGASSNRFWPIIGNHDYFSDAYAAYRNYFTLPGNERYYELVRGPVHFFMINGDSHEDDGTSATSVQARWLSNRLAAATAPWRLVLVHYPPYSSGGSFAGFRWPFKKWGASALLAGHNHVYERLSIDGLPNFVNGLGGASIHGFGATIEGSAFRYRGNHGAMLVVADDTQITFEFQAVTGGGTSIDRFTLSHSNAPPELEPIPLQDIAAGSTWRWKLKATDPDSAVDTLRFDLPQGGPTGLTIDARTGQLEWAPAAAQVPSTNALTIRVRDQGIPVGETHINVTLCAVPHPMPTLRLDRNPRAESEVWLHWPTNYGAGCRLQTWAGSEGRWQDMPGQAQISNGLWRVKTTLQSRSGYFRLGK